MEPTIEAIVRTAKALASKRFDRHEMEWVDCCIQLTIIGCKEYRDCIDAGDTEDNALRHAGELMRAKLWDSEPNDRSRFIMKDGEVQVDRSNNE